MVTFFPDTKQVSRLDVFLKAAVPPDALRQQFGNRIMTRDRMGGGIEEIYYPKIHGLVFADRSSTLAAVSYLSPRYVADLYVERFDEFMREKRYDDAQTEADKAVLIDPDYARGYLAQGTYYQSQKNNEEAIVRFIAGTNAKYASRVRATAHARLGALYWADKMLADKAEVEFKKAISIAPELDEAHYLYGTFLDAQKRKEEALARMSAALQLNAGNIGARLFLADAFFQKEDYPQALPHYEALSRWVETRNAGEYKDRFRADTHFRYAYCLAKKGDSTPAIEGYTRALQRDPAFVLAYNNRGREYQSLGDFDKAIEDFRAGLKLDPKHLLLNQNLGRALLESSRFEEAKRQLELALSLHPGNASLTVDLARCWGALGKKKQTLQFVQQAVAAGYKDRSRLTSDRYLSLIQKEGDFKKLLLQLQ